MFRGSELTRLVGGLMMMAVLLLLFFRLRDPNMWTWFVAHRPAAAPARADGGKGPPDVKTSSASKLPDHRQEDAQRAADEAGTDQDPGEAREAAMEFQAVTDGSLELQREEMVPYDRIVRWVQNQSFDALMRRARSDLLFRQLYQSPDKYRGKLVALNLNVRQVLDAGKNDNGVQLWEVVGWTRESKAWLYWTIVVDLPQGMPTGPDVSEKARFVGYFFKLQGYHEAGAKPNEPPLKAPLLIGRLQWEPVAAAAPGEATSEATWGMLLVAAAGAAIGLRLAYLVLVRKPRRKSELAAGHHPRMSLPVEAWLDDRSRLANDGDSRLAGRREPNDEGRTGGDGQPRDGGPPTGPLDEP